MFYLGYNCVTVLNEFRLYKEGDQLCVHREPVSLALPTRRPLPHLSRYHRAQSWVPGAMSRATLAV